MKKLMFVGIMAIALLLIINSRGQGVMGTTMPKPVNEQTPDKKSQALDTIPQLRDTLESGFYKAGQPDKISEKKARIFNNPAENEVKIIAYQKESWELYNFLGTKMKSFDVFPGNNTLDVSTLPPGIYFLKSVSFSQKLVKK